MKREETSNTVERKNIRKPLMIAIIAGALVLIGILGAYAFFVTSGTNQNENLSVQTGTMSLTFSDGSAAFTGGPLEFGSSATKTFTITNGGSLDAVAKINWKNLTNTYTDGSLTYTLSYSETESGTYTDIITNKNVPRSVTETTTELANGLTVPAGKTYYYKLVITLNYLESTDQTADINAMLSTHFTLEEGTIDRTGRATEVLLSKKNDDSVTDYNSGNKGEMYTFSHNNLITTSLNWDNATFTHSATQVMDWTEEERTDYRYIGNTPNNYIDFSNETWRIIGVFTVENESGTKEQRVKIIRDEIYKNLSWDYNEVNEWPTSTLSTLLNGDYVNREENFTYTWYDEDGVKYAPINGLTAIAKTQISPVKWYLGGSSTYENLEATDYYNFERGETTCANVTVNDAYNIDGCPGETRSTNTIATVGLMYPSDYAYTYANGVDNTCYTNGYSCKTNKGGTPSNGWLFNSSADQLTISPYASSPDDVIEVSSSGWVIANWVKTFPRWGRPSVYLNSDVEIIGGDGTSGNHYQLKES